MVNRVIKDFKCIHRDLNGVKKQQISFITIVTKKLKFLEVNKIAIETKLLKIISKNQKLFKGEKKWWAN